MELRDVIVFAYLVFDVQIQTSVMDRMRLIMFQAKSGKTYVINV